MSVLNWLRNLRVKIRRAAVDAKTVIAMAVGVLLVGILYPIGLAAIEAYTPTDPTMLVVWPLIGVFAILAVAIYYIRQSSN